MMAARGGLPVLKVLFLFFTGRGGFYKEKEKNGGAKRADRVVRPYTVILPPCKFM